MVHFIGAEDRNRTGTRGKSRRILSPVRLPVPPLRHTTWLRATLPGGRPPSTIAAKELNFCVRYGNRCILFAIITTLYGKFGAGEGDRTLTAGLEGRNSTIELPPQIEFIQSGGGWWIRTTESNANRFTVCPLWPLGKSSTLELVIGIEPTTC